MKISRTSCRPGAALTGRVGRCFNTDSHQSSARRKCSGMSFVELMVAMGVGSIVLGTVMSLSLFGARSSSSVANYTEMDTKSRYALDLISREVRQATAVTAFQNTSTNKSLTFTNAMQGTTARVRWNSTSRTVVLERTGFPDLAALSGCDQWNFELYQRTPIVTSTNLLFYRATNVSGTITPSLCKLVNMSWKCSRSMLGQKWNTETVQASQLVLRNKQ